MNTFGKTIRLQRRLKSLTLKDLAAQTDLSISFLSEVERDVCQPSIASLRKIAQALNISLLGLSQSVPAPSNTATLSCAPPPAAGWGNLWRTG